jgi:hypothetical protein
MGYKEDDTYERLVKAQEWGARLTLRWNPESKVWKAMIAQDGNNAHMALVREEPDLWAAVQLVTDDWSHALSWGPQFKSEPAALGDDDIPF